MTAAGARSEGTLSIMSSLVHPLFDGPLDIVGDIHGEIDALRSLLVALGYAADGRHPAGRRLVFLGDLCDRGPDSPAVIECVRGLVEADRAQCVLGNHELNLLRHDLKHGNAWCLDPDHPEPEFGPCVAATPASRAAWHAFFLTLPLALERPDLRVTHAAWHPPAIELLRATTGSTLEAFDVHEHALLAELESTGLERAAAAEKQQYARELVDPTARVPLLRNLGMLDEHRQMRNPVRVTTSGPERVAREPFWANGKWRMCDRVRWWDEYADPVPVIVGHYWRKARAGDGPDLSGGKPDLFGGSPHDAWLGRDRKVFCVDYSVGGRYLERDQPAFTTRLAAVRWPEQQLVFDDGTSRAMIR